VRRTRKVYSPKCVEGAVSETQFVGSTHFPRMINKATTPRRVRFSAMLGQEPEIEQALS
jgi:hypothetical protein